MSRQLSHVSAKLVTRTHTHAHTHHTPTHPHIYVHTHTHTHTHTHIAKETYLRTTVTNSTDMHITTLYHKLHTVHAPGKR